MSNPYETDELLNQYLNFHYGETTFGVVNYPQACAELCIGHMAQRSTRLAVDLGCAVGRSSFELTRIFDRVIGIDLSMRFIHAAKQLQEGRTIEAWLPDEGELGHVERVELAQTGLSATAHRATFKQGDACAIDPDIPAADLVFAGNLIDRVTDPRAFLESLQHRVAKGGVLVISSPYTLLTEYTPKPHWIGGCYLNGQAVRMRDGIRNILEPAFRPLGPPQDLPFVIRETARKFQHSVADVTVWERVP